MKTAVYNIEGRVGVLRPAEIRGEQKLLEAYDLYSDAIFRYCYYRIFDRDKAKDCLQEAYCRAWRYMLEGKTIENIRAFLYKTANNIIIDEYRKRKNVSLDFVMEKGFTPKADYRKKTEEYFMNADMISIIKTLDGKYRDVILMKYVDDLSTKEIASALQESENNVYVRMSRGLEKVREILRVRGA